MSAYNPKEELKRRGITEERIISFRFDSLQYDAIRDYKALYQAIAAKLPARYRLYIVSNSRLRYWRRK